MPISEIEPTNQTYPVAKIQGLQAALDAKSSISHTHAIAIIEGLQAVLNAKSPINHSHAIALIEGLQVALDGKSSISHTHAIAAIAGLQAALDAKSPTSHTHSPEAWQLIPMPTGWAKYNTIVPAPQFRKFLNFIEIKGTILKSAGTAANELIFTLPASYRPAETRYFITWNVNSNSRVQIDMDGSIKVTTAGNTYAVGLDITFGLN